MPGPYLDSPATERDEQSRIDKTNFDVDFSIMPSFASPAKRDDDLLNQIKGMGNTKGTRILATPRLRQPLGERNNPPGKVEFTPLLKSATANRLKQMSDGPKDSGLTTPAALRPGFRLDVTPLPEHSAIDSSSVVEDEGTPVPAVASSSLDLSTPLALPKRGEGGLGDGGNVLTLREQEAKLEQIDKENFGLKLKIHFLEENLKRTGPEAGQIAIRENSELQANKMLMERELKKYQKHLKTADQELEQYRQQLLDYADKVKRRHMSEEMQEEMTELRQRVEEQDATIKALQEQLGQATGDNEEIQILKGDLEDADREIREKSEQLDKQGDELQELREKFDAQERGESTSREKDERIEEQADQIEELREELRHTTEQKDTELDQLEDRLAEEAEKHNEAMQELQGRLDRTDQARRRLEEQLQSQDSNEEVKVLREQLEQLERQKSGEVQSLEDRLRLAESAKDQQLQLAEQEAHNAEEQLRTLTRVKDSQIAEMQNKLDLADNTQNESDETKKQLLHQFEEAKGLRKKNERQAEEMQSLTAQLGNMSEDMSGLRAAIKERDITLQELERLRQDFEESQRLLAKSKKAEEALTKTSEDLRQAQTDLADRERQLSSVKTTLEERTAELEALREFEKEPDSQLENVNNIVRERGADLEALRSSYDAVQGKLDDVQKLAEERNASLLALREELATTKQNLEDEIQVLESSLDNAEQVKDDLEAKIESMGKETAAAFELRHQLEPLEKDLRTAEREKEILQQEVNGLERDLEIADKERTSMQDKIKALTRDLEASRDAAEGRSPRSLKELTGKSRTLQNQVDSLRLQLADKQDQLADAETKLALRSSPGSSRKLQQECDTLKATLEVRNRELKAIDQITQEQVRELEKKHAKEVKHQASLFKSTAAELETARRRLAEKEAHLGGMNAETASLLREKDRKLHDLQKESHQSNQQAQETQTLQLEVAGLRRKERDVIKLRDELVDTERRHALELKGLARQIQWLRSQGAREAGFREMLCYEKRWMTMQINMFGACNKENLRLLQEMGIHPDISIHERRPRLKTVGLAVIAAVRMKRWQREWAASKELHKSLMKKMESMRRGPSRSKIVSAG